MGEHNTPVYARLRLGRIDIRLKDCLKAALVIVINPSTLAVQPMREGGAHRQISHGRQGCGIFEGGDFFFGQRWGILHL